MTMLCVVPLPEWIQDLSPLDEVGVVQGVVPLILKGAVLSCAVCVLLSAVSVFRATEPPEIPCVSAEATRRSERANSSWLEASLFDMLPSPAWFPMLGRLAFSMVFSDYIMTMAQILGSVWNSLF